KRRIPLNRHAEGGAQLAQVIVAVAVDGVRTHGNRLAVDVQGVRVRLNQAGGNGAGRVHEVFGTAGNINAAGRQVDGRIGARPAGGKGAAAGRAVPGQVVQAHIIFTVEQIGIK